MRLDAHSGELRNNISVDLVKNSARFSHVIKSSPNGKCVFYVICFDMLSVLIFLSLFDVDLSGILGNMSELKSFIEDCLLRPYTDVSFVGLPEERVNIT